MKFCFEYFCIVRTISKLPNEILSIKHLELVRSTQPGMAYANMMNTLFRGNQIAHVEGGY